MLQMTRDRILGRALTGSRQTRVIKARDMPGRPPNLGAVAEPRDISIVRQFYLFSMTLPEGDQVFSFARRPIGRMAVRPRSHGAHGCAATNINAVLPSRM